MFAFVALLFTACELPREIGLPTGNLVDVRYTDTLTIKTSTVLLDSIRTSATSQLLVGSYIDPIFGKISARAYAEFAPTSFVFGTDKIYQYDSVGISMTYGHFYGDTLQPFQVNIHRLKDTLVTAKTYYNYDTAPYNPNVYAKLSFTPQSSTSNVLFTRLPDDFGRQMFSALLGSGDPLNAASFVRLMKGFAFVSDASNRAMTGFPVANIRVILYLHENGTIGGGGLSFPLITRRFNHIEADRSGTALANLKPLKATPPKDLGGLTYIQDAVGIVTKIEIPYLSSLQKNGHIAINRAELSVTPEVNTGYYPLPSAMVLTETDETNTVLRSKSDLELIVGTDGSTYSSIVSPQLVGYNYQYKNYNFVLTTYLQSIISGYKKTKGFLLMPLNNEAWAGYVSTNRVSPTKYWPYLNSKVTRLTIKPSPTNPKLVVFYTTTQ